MVPRLYGRLSLKDRYEIARLLGRINRASPREAAKTMLLGPGRWGTFSPDLGVPVHFSEISQVSVLCEIVTMRENLIPDVSLGTHFLNELVETDVLYMALFPQQETNYLNEDFFLNAPNRLPDTLANGAKWQEVVRLIDTRDRLAAGQAVLLLADASQQKAQIFVHDIAAGDMPAES